MTRKPRAAIDQITVKNPNGVKRGVAQMTVDGEEVAVDTVGWKPAGSVCRVEVELG